jgi:AcrR family transcriptional regulator
MPEETTLPRALIAVTPEAVEPRPEAAYERLKPGPGRSRADVQADQRDRIHRAIVDLVGESSLKKVGIRSIARLAGVSTETFYAHFGGKDVCALSAYRAIISSACADVRAARDVSLEAREQAEAAFDALFDDLFRSEETARFALVECFDGGSAGLAEIRTAEETLDVSLFECLARRERRVSRTAASWVTAGCLRSARAAVQSGRTSRREAYTGLVGWALDCLDEDVPNLAGRARRGEAPRAPILAVTSRPDDEQGRRDEDLILAATRRVVRGEGYARLSMTKIRSAAGLSGAAVKRCFGSADECFLAAMSEQATTYFAGSGRESVDREGWLVDLHGETTALLEAVASEPRLGQAVFNDIVGPGVSGLERREWLIGEVARQWRDRVPEGCRPDLECSAAAIAGLWRAISRQLDLGRASRLPREATTFTLLQAAPVVGEPGAVRGLK